jgi:hypothetical protein
LMLDIARPLSKLPRKTRQAPALTHAPGINGITTCQRR